MNTAQGFYEVYKSLPKKVQKEVIDLITHDNEEYIQICVPALVDGLNELKEVKAGKKQSRPVSELLKELKNGV
jgi:hypothetical protein